jgi:hypothetical protein
MDTVGEIGEEAHPRREMFFLGTLLGVFEYGE